MKTSLGVWVARRELSFMCMAWASPKSQPSASFPIKMQKIHKWHGSSMYHRQPALPHSWGLFAGWGGGEDENPGEWEGQSGKIQRLFLFFNPLIGIRVLSPLPCSHKYLGLDRIFFPLPWHQLKDYHLLLLVAAAFQTEVGGFVQSNWGALLTHLFLPPEPCGWGVCPHCTARCVTSLSKSLVWSSGHTLEKMSNLGWKHYWMLRLLWRVELGTTPPLTVNSTRKMNPCCHKTLLNKCLNISITLSLGMLHMSAVRQIFVFWIRALRISAEL